MSTNGSSEGRVAVYIDFDNVVISRREQASREKVDPAIDLDAILDFASSFGTVATSRAYADWSRGENAAYQQELVRRAVFLVQMFTTSGKLKNGADIRLAIDVVEDLSLFPDITHVVIVAGDSDYIPLAQHVKRYGRYMVGIGVAGSISKNLASACDEYWDYDNLPGLHAEGDDEGEAARPAENAAGVVDARAGGVADASAPAARAGSATAAEGTSTVGKEPGDADASADAAPISKSRASQLLLRAIEFGASRTQQDWQPASSVKNQILRMEPGFQESALGFSKFSDFLRSRGGIVEYDEGKQRIRIRPAGRAD